MYLLTQHHCPIFLIYIILKFRQIQILSHSFNQLILRLTIAQREENGENFFYKYENNLRNSVTSIPFDAMNFFNKIHLH